MFLRYLILFGGIVMMITGCNSLISQQFGTHRLRTANLEDVLETGLGDSDFVELDHAVLGTPFIVGAALRATDKDYVLRPVFTAAQEKSWQDGQLVTISYVAWTETIDASCLAPPGCLPDPSVPIRGLVSAPTGQKNPTEEWASQRIKLDEEVTYLQLYEKPMAWYWNLTLFVGGLLLSLLPEAVAHRRRTVKEPVD